MPLTINTITLLQKYLDGVIRRADHHADNVNKIVFALIGGVIWRTTDDIEVRSYKTRLQIFYIYLLMEQLILLSLITIQVI